MAKQTFTSGQVLTAAQVNALQSNDFNQTVTTKTTSYTPTTTTDIGTRVIMNSASATTITINTSIYSAGDTFFISNIGVGVCTLTAGTCTITSAGPLAIPQYGGGLLYFTSASAAIYYPTAVTIPPASSGLNFIASGTFTGVSQGTVTGCFTSTYDNYKVIIDASDIDGDSYLLFGTGGTISTATNTDWATTNSISGGVAGASATNQSKALIMRNAGIVTINIEIIAPNLATETKHTATYGGTLTGTSGVNGTSGAAIRNSTQFTDFTIRSDAHPTGDISFKYKVYGYSNT